MYYNDQFNVILFLTHHLNFGDPEDHRYKFYRRWDKQHIGAKVWVCFTYNDKPYCLGSFKLKDKATIKTAFHKNNHYELQGLDYLKIEAATNKFLKFFNERYFFQEV